MKIKDKTLTLYIRMDLCDKSLSEIISMLKDDKDLIDTSVLSPHKYFITCGIFIELLEGLNYLHKQNPIIIHKDLRPENILIIMDFNKDVKFFSEGDFT
jgi:serine/threonine protein kinase